MLVIDYGITSFHLLPTITDSKQQVNHFLLPSHSPLLPTLHQFTVL